MDRRITSAASIDHLPEAMAFVLSCARESGFIGERLADIRLAVEEAVVNIIGHAYGGAKGEFDIVCASRAGGGVVIEISDAGIPFDILSVPDPDIDAGIADRAIGGLGVYLIRKLVNEVNYKRVGKRNVLTLTIYNERPE